VLVVERHDVTARGEAAQIVQGPVIAEPDIGPDLGGALVGRGSEYAKADGQPGGRRAGHPGQLPGADHADGRDRGCGRLPGGRRRGALVELFTHGP